MSFMSLKMNGKESKQRILIQVSSIRQGHVSRKGVLHNESLGSGTASAAFSSNAFLIEAHSSPSAGNSSFFSASTVNNFLITMKIRTSIIHR
jgi:hypothetical protein